LSYQNVAAGCFVTVFLSGAMAATEPATKAQAPTSTAPQAPAEPSASKSSTPPSTPSTPSVQTPAPMPPGHGTKAANKAPAEPVKKVDLNNATLEELKTLPTVGDAEAKKIIAHRPYKSKGELVTKAGLPEGVYHAVKRKVELQKPRKPAPKK
jgi:DNA uptake protein ComE-like DNA-binding protein